jgi:hypothetical protein
MITGIRNAPFHAVLVALVCVAGCAHKPHEQGLAERCFFWSSGAGVRVPGIDERSVALITLKAGPPEGVPFAIWSDLPNGVGGSSEGTARGASYRGHLSAADGRRVEFHAKTRDGKSGSLTIAGVDYDLAKGRLFLVSTRADPPMVAQLAFDLDRIPKGSEELQDLAKSNPQIRKFFQQHKRGDAKPK